MQGQVRRIVTGHDRDGNAVVISDAVAPSILADKWRPGRYVTQVWVTDSIPAPLSRQIGGGDRPVKLEPPAKGAALKIVELPPDQEGSEAISSEAVKESFAAMQATGASTQSPTGRHAYIHRTETLDYGVVISGEAYLILDTSEILLKAGDVVIQAGTNHSWSNRSNAPCRIAFFMMGGQFDDDLKKKFG